jgi:hypothetical protein
MDKMSLGDTDQHMHRKNEKPERPQTGGFTDNNKI